MMNQDAERLLEYMDARGIDGGQQITRGWHHIGALITDSVLQRRQKYKATVFPRVQALVEEWPDAATTSGFRTRINQGGLSDIIRWNGQQRVQQIEDMVEFSRHWRSKTLNPCTSTSNPAQNATSFVPLLGRFATWALKRSTTWTSWLASKRAQPWIPASKST